MKATSLAINVYRLSASRVREESKEFATFSPVSSAREKSSAMINAEEQRPLSNSSETHLAESLLGERKGEDSRKIGSNVRAEVEYL